MKRKRRLERIVAFMMAAALILTGMMPATAANAAQTNHIVALGIKTLPENSTIEVGEMFNFNPQIIKTEKNGATTGCVYFEVYKYGNSAYAQSSRWGKIYPVKAGEFKVRAVAFANTSDMNKWKEARAANNYIEDEAAGEKYVTAYSDWETIQVVNKAGEEGLAVARWQYQLEKAVANKSVSQVLFTTENARTYTIPKGNYSKKSLVIDAPNADIINNGRFKEITLEQIKPDTFSELAKGNSFLVKAVNASIKLLEGAEIKAIKVDQQSSGTLLPSLKINAAVGSSIAGINLMGAASMNISGGSKQAIPVVVEKGAGGSTLTSSTPLHAELKADTNVVLNKGAKGSEIKITGSSVNANFAGTENAGLLLEVAGTAKEAKLNLNMGGITLLINAEASIMAGQQAENTKIELLSAVGLNITGTAANMQLTVGSNAAGATINTGVALDIKANAVVNIIAGKGAEGITIKEAEGVNTIVKNETGKEIIKIGEDGTETKIEPGVEESGSTDGDAPIVAPPPVVVTTLSLSESALTLVIGETATLKATVNPAGTALTWASSDAKVASVSGGVVMARAEGNAIITVRGGTATKKCTVTVKAVTTPTPTATATPTPTATVTPTPTATVTPTPTAMPTPILDIITVKNGDAEIANNTIELSSVTSASITLNATAVGSDSNLISAGFRWEVSAAGGVANNNEISVSSATITVSGSGSIAAKDTAVTVVTTQNSTSNSITIEVQGTAGVIADNTTITVTLKANDANNTGNIKSKIITIKFLASPTSTS